MFLSINEKVIGVKFFDNIRMFRYGRTNVEKEKLYGGKKRIKIWNVNVNNIVISKLLGTKNNL